MSQDGDELVNQQAINAELVRRMQADLDRVHKRAQLTGFFEATTPAFLVGTASFCVGQLVVLSEQNGFDKSHVGSLMKEAAEAVKALHVAMRMVDAGYEIEKGKGKKAERKPGEAPDDRR